MHNICRTVAILSGALALVIPGAVLAQQARQPVEIAFAAQVGDQQAVCGRDYTGVGTTTASLTLQDFRVYVSAVRLIAATGDEVPVQLTPDGQWQSETVTLLDFVDGTGSCNGNAGTNSVVRGTVPTGDYRGVVFEIGVPYAENHQDPTLAAAPLNVTGMTWPWRIGYKFIGIDIETSGGQTSGVTPGPNSATGFSIHLGSTECGEGAPMSAPSAPCGNPNRPTYRFDHFNLTANRLVLDLGALLARTDITINAPETAPGCMSFGGDTDCTAIMDRLGLPFDGQPSGGQQWIRVE